MKNLLAILVALLCITSCGSNVKQEQWNKQAWGIFGLEGIKPPTNAINQGDLWLEDNEVLFNFKVKKYGQGEDYVRQCVKYILKTYKEVYLVPDKSGATPTFKITSSDVNRTSRSLNSGVRYTLIYKYDGLFYRFNGTVSVEKYNKNTKAESSVLISSGLY